MDINLRDIESLENGLNFLTDRFTDFRSFLSDIQLPEYGDYFEYPFPLKCHPLDKLDLTEEWSELGNKDEIVFYISCIKAGKSEEISNIIILLIELNQYIKQRYATDCVWENNETPFGLLPAALLAFYDGQHIDLFLQFLQTNDLQHETYQSSLIRHIVEHQGWNPATLKLAFYRATILAGENGLLQFDEFLSDMGLDQYLTSEEGIQHWFSLKSTLTEDDLDDVLDMVDAALRDVRAYEEQKSEGFDNKIEGKSTYIISQNWFDTFKEAVLYVSARGGKICEKLDSDTQIALSSEPDWPDDLTEKADSLKVLRLWKTITTRKEAKETVKRIYERFESAIDTNDRAALASLLFQYPQVIRDYQEGGSFEKMLHRKIKTSTDLKGMVYLIGRHSESRWLYEVLHHHPIGRLLSFIEENDELSVEFLNQALFVAISNEDVDSIELLIRRGADLKCARGIGNQGPMEWTFWSGNAPKLTVVKALLQHGADPNERSAKGKTPLMYAFSKIGQTHSSFNEWKNIIDLLLTWGANILERDKQGNCILDYAKTLSNNAHGMLKTNIDGMIDSLF